MQRTLAAALLGLLLATPAVAQTTSQAPDWRQQLGGLLNGNQDRDKAVQQAYERGYERGRNDEMRQSSTNRQPHYDNRNYNQGRSDYYNR
jgi:hypothetical protein